MGFFFFYPTLLPACWRQHNVSNTNNNKSELKPVEIKVYKINSSKVNDQIKLVNDTNPKNRIDKLYFVFENYAGNKRIICENDTLSWKNSIMYWNTTQYPYPKWTDELVDEYKFIRRIKPVEYIIHIDTPEGEYFSSPALSQRPALTPTSSPAVAVSRSPPVTTTPSATPTGCGLYQLERAERGKGVTKLNNGLQSKIMYSLQYQPVEEQGKKKTTIWIVEKNNIKERFVILIVLFFTCLHYNRS